MKKTIRTIFSFLTKPFTHPFAKRNILLTFYRILKWQVLSRVKMESVEPWVNDIKVVCRNGDTGFTGNIYYGLMEYDDMIFILHLLDKDDTFLDIGSNLGSYSLLASGVCSSYTYSFEPSPTTFKRLLRNVEINHLNNLTCLNIGAGEENGRFLMTESKGPENHFILNDHSFDDSVKVEVKRIDDIDFSSSPTFIKIDTEGTELCVIRGALKTLKLESMIGLLVEINGNNDRYNETDEEMILLLNSMNYFSYRFDSVNKKLHKTNKVNSKGNTLFIKNYAIALSKIKRYKGTTLWNFDL